jgi:hypothetical protein
MNVMMWGYGSFDSEIFEFGKVCYSNSIIITNFVQNSFPIAGLKMSSLPTLELKSPNKIFKCYLGNLSNTHYSSS